MKKTVLRSILILALAAGAAACGSQPNTGYDGAYPEQYAGISQYGQYVNYNGDQVWVPNEQPPVSWIPGQSYYQGGAEYMPPYYSTLNQPEYWQYYPQIGWGYRARRR